MGKFLIWPLFNTFFVELEWFYIASANIYFHHFRVTLAMIWLGVIQYHSDSIAVLEISRSMEIASNEKIACIVKSNRATTNEKKQTPTEKIKIK